jgi:site-specific DNA-methyltransferase (adenine-specific)
VSDVREVFKTSRGALYCGDSLSWLAGLPDASVRLVVADPPYGVAKAEWDTFESRTAYVDWSRRWLVEVARVLSDDGSAYVMGFSEVLADVKWAAADLFAGCRWLVWHYRNKANLRNDWGRSHESVLHLRKSRSFVMNVDSVRIPYNAHTRKYPRRAQGHSSTFQRGADSKSWQPHPLGAKPRDVLEIPILNNGMDEKTPHPTQKPRELIRRLVAASSNPGDLVLDPFAGSGTTPEICELLDRRWLSCDQSEEYCAWVAERVTAVGEGRTTMDDLKRAEQRMAVNRTKVRG